MIDIQQISKFIGDKTILDNISFTIPEGQVFGLIGTNGAGKSTLLRTMAGVHKPDHGFVSIDSQKVYQNPAAKETIFFIPDDLYFPGISSTIDMGKYYQTLYPQFDMKKFKKLLTSFSLPTKGNVNNLSKGMKRQVAIICGICANTKYLYCDETFDGLDPVIRQSIKTLFAKEMEDRGLTTIIASHNLREQEDICENLAVLHKGKLVFSKDVLALKTGVQKVECCFTSEEEAAKCLSKLPIAQQTQKGPMYFLTIKGDQEETLRTLHEASTSYLEILPLTLEEIFIEEMEEIGYDIKKLILD